ncbi:MAG TPA: hypothetical protein VH589_01830 [Trebonia sp.]
MARLRRARPPAARAGAAIIAAVGLVLATAGCGGSPSSAGSGGSADTQLVAFSRCMRSDGVPNFPDPSSNGKFPSAQQLGVSSSRYQTASSACRHLLPAGANGQLSAAETQQLLTGMRRFSGCMRSHGVPNWPDPTTDSAGQPVFDISSHGITHSERHSPRVEAAMTECQHLLPGWLTGGPPLN